MDNLRIYNYGISYEDVKAIYDDERLGIEDFQMFANVQVYPNPVKDYLYFELTTTPVSLISMSVYDMKGQKVIAAEFKTNLQGFVKEDLDFSNLGAGAYILNIESDTKKYTRKIIVSE